MMFKNIAVAHDGTSCSDLALEYAFDFATQFGAKVTVFHVTDFSSAALVMAGPVISDAGPVFHALRQESETIAEHVRACARQAGVAVDVRDVGNTPATGILENAKRTGADLIIVGSHGKHGLRKFFDPSVSLQVASECHVPLLIVPHDAPACEI